MSPVHLTLLGDLPTSGLLAALSGLDRIGGERELVLHHRDSLLNHTPRGHAESPYGVDPALARALSLELDGLVLLDQPGVGRSAYLCGLLLQEERPPAAPLDELLEKLLGPKLEGPDLRVDRVRIGAPAGAMEPDGMPISRVFFPGVDAEGFERSGLHLPGMRWRPRTSWATAMPWIELDGAHPLEEAELAELVARLGCPAMAIWIPGRGRPFRWVEAGGGQAALSGVEAGLEAFAERLDRIARFCEEAPAALFGWGAADWREG